MIDLNTTTTRDTTMVDKYMYIPNDDKQRIPQHLVDLDYRLKTLESTTNKYSTILSKVF